MDNRLMIEVWMRKAGKGYQYRGLVRRGTDYLYEGAWLNTQQQAAREATAACEAIGKREKQRVKH